MDNKTLGVNYYSDMNDAPLSHLLVQAIIKTEKQLVVLSDSIWKYCLDTGIIAGAVAPPITSQ